jgi:hypothetical protein
MAYSDGSISVPNGAVKRIYEDAIALVSVDAEFYGINVREMLIPYERESVIDYKPRRAQLGLGAIGEYSIVLSKPEREVHALVENIFNKDQVLTSETYPELRSGAILIRSHPEKGLFASGMNGLEGARSKLHTRIYYICLDDR